ncbi:hypothetical protein PoB_000486800 [Plakobranchus ocellatus]|uniref:Uncharacterized protein n=1 Tax=Plakobranchus ocellatus TaxID=259542 RepID=A0AAV3Y776_9GAST|nr:hypothetical protein PoB_000486800 [Plakobranchus ocellatus]
MRCFNTRGWARPDQMVPARSSDSADTPPSPNQKDGQITRTEWKNLPIPSFGIIRPSPWSFDPSKNTICDF